MARIGKYCKAYYIAQLREFSGWNGEPGFPRGEADLNGKEGDAARDLNEAGFLYLQEDFTVTKGVFADEESVFTDVTPAWIEFCRATLKFEPPVRGSAIPVVSEEMK